MEQTPLSSLLFPRIQEPRELLQLEGGGEVTEIRPHLSHSIYLLIHLVVETEPWAWAPWACAHHCATLPPLFHRQVLSERPGESQKVCQAQRKERRDTGKEIKRWRGSETGRWRKARRAGKGVQGGGGRENFLGLLPRPPGQSGRQEAGGPGQTMARRSAEPGTKFGVAFAGRGAARSSPCKGETK